MPGQRFAIRIANDRRHFSIFVNNAFICQFDHFDRSSHIRRVSVFGDVRLYQMMFQRFRHVGQGTRVNVTPGSSMQPVAINQPPPPYSVAIGQQPVPSTYPVAGPVQTQPVMMTQPMVVTTCDSKRDRRRKCVRRMMFRHALFGALH
ncbi:hypothetical protein WR25_06472 [Diploscapter pachys]|uniref:Galectin n=1 Tax=Diploscapter pachys TaxID=2018661 RepID=A0A2A2LFG5_9BILA|nr:hypothetical protein WR25_06472 [Diploscapter pachys]